MDEQWISIWNLINTGGVIALLFVNLWLMIRGELLPRRIYEDLTKRILEEVCLRIIEGVRAVLRELLREVLREELARRRSASEPR